jgi:uncharacterized protein (UPF0332 family)
MFDFRQKSDYEDFVTFEQNEVREWLEGAKLFIKELEELIGREV